MDPFSNKNMFCLEYVGGFGFFTMHCNSYIYFETKRVFLPFGRSVSRLRMSSLLCVFGGYRCIFASRLLVRALLLLSCEIALLVRIFVAINMGSSSASKSRSISRLNHDCFLDTRLLTLTLPLITLDHSDLFATKNYLFKFPPHYPECLSDDSTIRNN